MDRPRSPVKDAGRWVRSIQPLWCPPTAKHEERGRLPCWERRPRSLAPIRLSLAAHQAAPVEPATLYAAGPGSLPVHRLLQPALDGRFLTMIVVLAVDYLLDVNLIVVVAAVADVLPVADLVVDGGCGAGNLHDKLCLSLDPDSWHPLRHSVDDAVARPNHPGGVGKRQPEDGLGL